MNKSSLTNLKPFTKGRSGNPAGRNNAAKRAAGEAAWKALLADFEVHGAAAIEAMRAASPTAYVQLACSGLPTETRLEASHVMAESLSEDQARRMAEEYLKGQPRSG